MASDEPVLHTRVLMHRGVDPELQARLDRLFAAFQGWCVTWGLSRLARDAVLEFSDELGLALGTCELRAGRIRLNAVLLRPGNEALLFETLCHEAAHLVAFLRYGPAISEHGPEWQDYMERAGYRPRAVIPAGLVEGLPASPAGSVGVHPSPRRSGTVRRRTPGGTRSRGFSS